MNNNTEEETSIQRCRNLLQAEYDRLMADPEISAAHALSVGKHREKIAQLKSADNYARFYADLTSQRMETLSRMHANFGANVFLAGPDVIPNEILAKHPSENLYFTVERGETAH